MSSPLHSWRLWCLAFALLLVVALSACATPSLPSPVRVSPQPSVERPKSVVVPPKPVAPPKPAPDPDLDQDGIPNERDNCPKHANTAQEDHDQNGVGDMCDPWTLSFRGVSVGRAMDPAKVRLVTSPKHDTLRTVRAHPDYGVGAHFEDGTLYVSYILEGLRAWKRRGDTDLFLEFPPGRWKPFTFEVWSEGAAAEEAGTGIEITVGGRGVTTIKQRRFRHRKTLGRVKLPKGLSSQDASLFQMRVRLRKGAGTTSTVAVDWRVQEEWVHAGTVTIRDDRMLRGRNTTLVNYGFQGSRAVLRMTARPVLAAVKRLEVAKSFDGLDDWKVFQRGPDGTAPVPLSVVVRSERPVRLQAQISSASTSKPLAGWTFRDMSWEVAAAPQGTLVQRTLPNVPAGGNYMLDVRVVDAETGQEIAKDRVEQFAVGDIFLAIGQSNMSGYPLSMDPREPEDDRAHLFGNDFVWKRAREPMDDGDEQFDWRSKDHPQHSLLLRFAKDVALGSKVPVAIIPASNGRSDLHNNWARDPVHPMRRNTLYGSAISRVRSLRLAHPLRAVLWYQGESDYSIKPSGSYLERLHELVPNLRKDLNNPKLLFFSFQLATYAKADAERWLAYQDVQRQHAVADPRAILISTLDLTRNDPIHLNVRGYRRAGARMARAVLFALHNKGQLPGPQLRFARHDSQHGVEAVLVYDRPIQGGHPDLFRARDGLGKLRVVEVRTQGTQLVLTFERPAHGETSLSYGYSNDPASPFVHDGHDAGLAFRNVLLLEHQPALSSTPSQPTR